jgi:hypothetical protein
MESCRDGAGAIPLSCGSGLCGWLLSRGGIMIRSGRRYVSGGQVGVGCRETVRKWVHLAMTSSMHDINTPERIMRLGNAFDEAKALLTVVDLDLFSALHSDGHRGKDPAAHGAAQSRPV